MKSSHDAPLDAAKTRPMSGGPSFSLGNRLYRALFAVAWALLCAWNPRGTLWRWRVSVLRAFGGQIDWAARIYPTARIWSPANLAMAARACLGPGVRCYSMAAITLEADAVVSQGAHLCAGTHDLASDDFQLVVKPIDVGAGAWIAAEAFVGPGVRIGAGAVLAARGVAFADLVDGGVYLGNPAELKRIRAVADIPGGPK